MTPAPRFRNRPAVHARSPRLRCIGRILSWLSVPLLVVATAGAASVPATVHPGWEKLDLRPAGFEPQVSGMAFLSDGRLVVANWDTVRSRGSGEETPRAYSGKVHVLSGVLGNSPDVHVDTIAWGLEDVMGLAVVNDTIYVSGGNTILRLNRTGNDGPVTSVDTVFILPGTPLTGSTDSLHPKHGSQEYLNGLLHRDGKFYVSPSSLDPIGVVGTPQLNPYRGTYLEVTPGNGVTDKRGSFRIMANGIRAASGMGFGPEGRHCISDNQGEWLPGNKLICIREGAFYGSRKSGGIAEAYYAPWDELVETPPTVWGVQNEIANSPTAPLYLESGPYAGQILMGDVRWGGIQRYFLEKNALGEFQGAVFVFTGGLEAGVFRLAVGPDSMLYAGMIGGRNDGDGYPKYLKSSTRVDYGLQKLRFLGETPAFEMLALRARPTGFEIEFTRPVDTAVAGSAAAYTVESYRMTPSSVYGGGSKQELTTIAPSKVRIAADRRKVYLELGTIPVSIPAAQRVVHLRLNGYKSETGDEPWTTEAWYTLNAAGTGTPFDAPVALASARHSGARGLPRAVVRGMTLVLVTPEDGPFTARLRGSDGALVATYRGRGPGEHAYPLPSGAGRVGILEIRAGSSVSRTLLARP